MANSNANGINNIFFFIFFTPFFKNLS
jgi:hypothetical protein